MSGAVGAMGTAPPAVAADAGAAPNQEAWNTATATSGGSAANAQAAQQQQLQTQMMGQIEQIAMMPLVMQAMNAGQDDDS